MSRVDRKLHHPNRAVVIERLSAWNVDDIDPQPLGTLENDNVGTYSHCLHGMGTKGTSM
jgi:hypothetical protein